MFTANCAIALMLLSGLPSSFQRLDGSTITTAQIDADVTAAISTAHIPGIGIALFSRGKIAYLHAYGYRDVHAKLPMTPDSVMTAASLTKPVFATLVMQLVKDGVIDLDAPIARYLPKPLPEYPGYDDLSTDPRWRQLTMRMLLDHTSGFPNWRRYTDDGRLRIFFTPGSRFAYSGEGFELAQLLVQTVTGEGLDRLMEARIFAPYGMSRTRMTWSAAFETDYANAYDEHGHSLGPQRRAQPDAAGGMQTTLRDYAAFVEAFVGGDLPAPLEALMLTPQITIHSRHEFPSLSTATTTANDRIRLSYGLGWGLYLSPYGRAFFKEGSDDGWRHYVVCFNKEQRGMLIMTNSSNGEHVYERLLRDVLGDRFTPLDWEGFPRSR